MKLTYLGTAASEGWPGIFCKCEACNRARELGGKNIRTRSQAIVNDNLLIDFPMDTYMHVLKSNIDFTKIDNLIFTHSHSDHCTLQDLEFRCNEVYGRNKVAKTLNLFGNDRVYELLKIQVPSYSNGNSHLTFTQLEPFKEVKIGKYLVTPLKARHSRNEDFVYIIKDGDKTLLYLHDTSTPPTESLDYLKEIGICFDLVSLDCTYGPTNEVGNHMSLGEAFRLKEWFKEVGIINEKTKCVLNHFSHNGALLYDELSKEGAKYGFLVSYDGMEIDI